MEGAQDDAPLHNILVFDRIENGNISSVNNEQSRLLASTILGESSFGAFGMGFPIDESGNEFDMLISQTPKNQTSMARNSNIISRNLSIPIHSSTQPHSPLYSSHSHSPSSGLLRQIIALMPTQNPSTSSVPNQNPNANSHGKTILPTPKAFGRQAVTSKQFFPHSPQAQSQYQLQSQLFHSPFDATSELLTTPFQTNLFSPIPFPLLNNPIDLMSPFSPILPPISAASPSQLTFSPQRVFEAEIMELSPQLLGFIQHQQQPVAAQTIWPNLNPITGSIPAFDTGLSNTELLCSPFKFLYPSPLPQWSQQSSPLSPSRVKGTAVLSLSPSQSSAAPPPARTTPLQIMNATMATKSNSKKRSVFGTSDNSLNSVISTVAKPKPRKKIKTRLSFEVVHANNLNDKNSGGFASPVPSPTDSVAIACGAGSNSLVWEFLNANDSPQSLSQLNMDVDINSTAALSTTNNEISVKMRHSVVTSVPVLTKAKRIFIEPSNRKEYRKDAEKHRREVLKGVFDGLNELIPSKKRKSRIPREQLLGNAVDYIIKLQKEGEIMSDTISRLEIEIKALNGFGIMIVERGEGTC